MKNGGVVVAVLLALIACGKRGDPRPPVPMIPQATSDVVVTQRAARVVLTWSYPSLTTAGRSLPSIRRVSVYRSVEELPPSAVIARDSTPGEPAVPDAVKNFANVPTLTAVQFAKLSQRIDSIEGAKLPAATVGSKLTYDDRPSIQSLSGRPVRLTYAIVTEGFTARSEFSNLTVIVPLPVAAPPTDVAAIAQAEGVLLKWNAPTASAAGSGKPVIVGYDIYRDTEDVEKPINPTPVPGTSYTDQPTYGDHTYRVTAVASAGPPKIQSDPSAPAPATFTDLVPPPAPASVTALVETRVVRLLWDVVDAPDLDGYNVYRTEGTIRIKLTPHPARQTHFRDESVDIGIPYFYSVTAVDKNKNESKPANSESILVPKTP